MSKTIVLDKIENNKDADYISDVIREQLIEKGIELNAFSFKIEVYYEEENQE